MLKTKRSENRPVVVVTFLKLQKQPPQVFYNKRCSCRPDACNFIKKETLTQMLSCEFCEISKNTFSKEHLRATASEAEDADYDNLWNRLFYTSHHMYFRGSSQILSF